MEETTTFQGLRHLFMTVFLYGFSAFIVAPVITDVSMEALCPGKDECSLAIYLSGFQQVITGVGALMMMPLVGSLSDKHGRKSLLTLPMTLNILPLAILAYSRETSIFYIYYVLKTFTSIFCEGSVLCLALAYVANREADFLAKNIQSSYDLHQADNVSEDHRASAFGILTGIGSCAFVCANFCARFLSTAATFQVATVIAILSTVYMRLFLPDSIQDNSLVASIVSSEKLSYTLLEDYPGQRNRISRVIRSVREMASLIRNSVPLFQVAMVSFFSSLSEAGLHASSMYYLKAKFHFNKDQFADLMIIFGVAGSVSQLLFMPILIPALKEEKLLSIGLFFGCAHMFLLSVAWSTWVPYMAAMFSLVSVFHQSCMRSIVSKQVASYEQGKAQGIISSICSLANVISPLAFSPLTDWFLSERAPFDFPGFSIMCAGFTMTIAFIQSLMIRATTPMPDMGSP